MHFVPSMLTAFLGYVQQFPITTATKSLRQVFASGEALGVEQVQQFFQHIGNSKTALHNLYGPTEASIDVSYFDCQTLGNSTIVPIGKPIENIQLQILNSNQQLVPIGTAGELYISGIGLSRGYLNNPTLTAEKFIPHPFKEEERLYKTGDLARWLPDGNIEFLGRIDHQLKIRGYRIEAGEIEQALLAHEAIQSAVVIGLDFENSKELVAYLVPKEGYPIPDIATLRSFLAASMPAYMIPAYFVELESLPLTSSGKVNRKALPAPDGDSIASGIPYEAARTPVEQTLVTIWEELLGRSPIGIHDDFFALGGHSLRAIRLLAMIQAQLSAKIKLSDLFTQPTIAHLALLIEPKEKVNSTQRISFTTEEQENTARELLAHLKQHNIEIEIKEDQVHLTGTEGMITSFLRNQILLYQEPIIALIQQTKAEKVALPPIPLVNIADSYVLSNAQRRLWVLEQMEDEQIAYNMPAAIRLQGNLNTKALEQTIQLLFERHESLRTNFVEGRQVIRKADFQLVVQDYTEADEQSIQKAIQDHAHFVFDLASDPLLQIKVLQIKTEEFILLFNMHHIITDGWSMTVLIRELSLLYAACVEEHKNTLSVLPTLPIQYKDYAAWQNDLLASEQMDPVRQFWLDTLVPDASKL